MTIAWFFPGQGSQTVGMAKDVYQESPAARDVFARADAALAGDGGRPLSQLILEGPEDQLTLTANTQPAIVTTSIALLAAIRERLPDLPSPAFAAGHSLGEYSAIVAAGGLTLEDAVRLVRMRGRAMQDAVPPGVGAMAAIMGVDPEPLEAICRDACRAPTTRGDAGEVVQPANYNAPGQIVIAGHASAVARASELVAAAKGKAIQLKVSAPFHCALMKPAADVVARELAAVPMASLTFPIVANYDAAPNQDPARARELLVRQVDGAVRWEQAVRFMHAQGVRRALEIGPGKVLAGLCKRIAKDVTVLSVGDAPSLDQVRNFLAS